MGKRHNDATRMQVLDLWKKGKSSNQIATALGASRGSIIGIVHRLREAGVDVARCAPPVRMALPPKVKPEEKFESAPPAAPPGKVTLMQLTPKVCRWPFDAEDGYLFCGAPAADHVYCEEHRLLAYSSPAAHPKKLVGKFARGLGVKTPNF